MCCTGRTGFIPVAPNNYPFYSSDHEVYTPVLQSDGGQLSEWQPMYQPSREQAEADRAAAYEAGVPHGYIAPGDRFKGLPTIELQVVSQLHDDSEYGSDIAEDGTHSGGPFAITRLSYAGKHLDDAQRTLEQYGIAYWHRKFPHWPIRVRRGLPWVWWARTIDSSISRAEALGGLEDMLVESLCPYVHPNEKARRRDPRLFEYEPLPCPDDKKELRRVDQPVHIPPTVARHPVTTLTADRYQWTDSAAAAAVAAATTQQQAWQANAAAAAMGQYTTYQQQQLALQGFVAQQRVQQQQQLAMLQAGVGALSAAQVQPQLWQQQQEQQQYQSAQAAAAAQQYMAMQQLLAQQQLMQQRPALAAAANARLAAAGRGTAANAGILARGGSSHSQHMLPSASLLQQQQQQAAVLAQMQALAGSATADVLVNSNLSSAISSRRSSVGMPNVGVLEPPAPPVVPAAAPSVVPPAVPGLAGIPAGPPAPLALPAAAAAAGVASGSVGSPLAQYASSQLTSERSGGLGPLPAAAADPAAAQRQLLALEAAAALVNGISSGCDPAALPRQLSMASDNAQSNMSDHSLLLWAAQNACNGAYNEPLPLGLADQELAVAAAMGGGGRGALPRYAHVQGSNSSSNGSHLLQGSGGGALSASSGSSNNMGTLSLAGSAGSNILTRLTPAAAAAAAAGAGRGLLQQQQQQAADVELLQAAMQQMGVHHLGDGEGLANAAGLELGEGLGLTITGLAEGLGLGLGLGLGDSLTTGLGLGLGLGEGLGEGLGDSSTTGLGLGLGDSTTAGLGVGLGDSISTGLGLGVGLGKPGLGLGGGLRVCAGGDIRSHLQYHSKQQAIVAAAAAAAASSSQQQ
ncbi:hypothetical protein COO60DRAFT_1634562 [Scenedesmus sp. NREL 46B-D3]|nr:hypothetical protein COO60DRAFT_1634562 [Scenedesmus sp. NREL 46B-D3]